MQFRCPNCQHAIQVEDSGFTHEEETLDGIECPSCHSHFNLSSDEETTVVATHGQTIGHFVIQEVLGEGSFGTVYKAHDPELNRLVAIKIPRAGRISPKTSKLFLREAQSAARVTHSNVVAVYEVGRHQDQYYIASEFIDGISLSEYLKDRSLPVKDTVELLIKVLRGVDAFHKEGIVHRDLKPANILLDSDSQPHITDFGLARHESENAITVTQNGDIFGTPVYMPPEQARGDVHQIDQRSDVYAVGVILYQLLTGKKPFKASSSRTLLYSIQNDTPAKPRAVDKRIPRELEIICQKAMEKDSAARYQSAAAMADDLQRWLDGHPILAKPASVSKRIVKWVARHKALSAAISVAVCSLVVAVVASLNSRPQIPDNMTAVVIETNPPADWIRFVRYDDLKRRPHENQFEARTQPEEIVYLQPGFYKVIAANNEGAFHEVWRTVPELNDAPAISDVAKTSTNFPHFQSWSKPDGSVVLPSIQLFRERDIEDPLVLLAGGSFEMGYHNKPGDIAPKHQQVVSDFHVGIHEVSYGRFQKMMTSHRPSHDASKTWLEFLDARYGSRDGNEPDLPVTGYPRDVAILYCELAGGRLPSHIEYEYAATGKGTTRFPTGNDPVIDGIEQWKIVPAAQPTPDQTQSGIQNLYFSVAEYTDSSPMNYALLYPDLFPPNPYLKFAKIKLESAMDAQVKDNADVRGAPENWVQGRPQTTIDSPRTPITLAQSMLFKTDSPVSLTDKQLAEDDAKRQSLFRTGWRLYRSSLKTILDAQE